MTDAHRVALASLLFMATAVLVLIDLATDLAAGVQPSHAAVEGVVVAISLVGGVVLWRELQAQRGRAAALETRLHRTEAEAQRWRAETEELLAGLGSAIDTQFARWELTPAEREVALLLLKGYSHKEIARIRGISDRTARQQGRCIYRKADLAGRAELSAFFLEGILLPVSSRTADESPQAGG